MSEPASPEVPKPIETETKADITPAVSHVVLGAIDKKNVDPAVRKVSNAELSSVKPDSLKEITEAGNKVSYKSRTKETTDTRALDVKIKEWNENFWDAAQALAGDANVSEEMRQERSHALASLGLDAAKTAQDGDQVEHFRQKYVAEDASNIGQFIEDLASGCKTDGNVDLNKLQGRLHAIKPMLSIFGKENDVNELVADFAMAHGILTQSEADKSTLAQSAQQEIAKVPTPSEQKRLQALWDEMDHELEITPEMIQAKQPEIMAAGRALGRPLHEDEAMILLKDGTPEDVVKQARADVQNDVLVIMSNIITESKLNDPKVSEEEKQKGMMAYQSEIEFGWALEDLQFPEEQRKSIVDLHKQVFNIYKNHGAQPVYTIRYVDTVENGFQPEINVQFAAFPQGVETQEQILAFFEKVRPEVAQVAEKNRQKEAEQSGSLQIGGEKKKGSHAKMEDDIWFDKDLGATIVCDGVSNPPGGDIAAQFVKNHLAQAYRNRPDFSSIKEAQNWLRDSIKEVNERLGVYKSSHADSINPDISTTLSTSFVWEGDNGQQFLITGNVGDSRVSLIREGTIKDLTLDHALFQFEVVPHPADSSQFTHDVNRPRSEADIRRLQEKFSTLTDPDSLPAEERYLWDKRNRVTSSVDGKNLRQLSISAEPVKPGDRIYHRTDGITDVITNQQTLDVLSHYKDPQEAAQALIRAAEAADQDPNNLREKGVDDKGVTIMDIMESEQQTEKKGQGEKPVTPDDAAVINLFLQPEKSGRLYDQLVGSTEESERKPWEAADQQKAQEGFKHVIEAELGEHFDSFEEARQRYIDIYQPGAKDLLKNLHDNGRGINYQNTNTPSQRTIENREQVGDFLHFGKRIKYKDAPDKLPSTARVYVTPKMNAVGEVAASVIEDALAKGYSPYGKLWDEASNKTGVNERQDRLLFICDTQTQLDIIMTKLRELQTAKPELFEEDPPMLAEKTDIPGVGLADEPIQDSNAEFADDKKSFNSLREEILDSAFDSVLTKVVGVKGETVMTEMSSGGSSPVDKRIFTLRDAIQNGTVSMEDILPLFRNAVREESLKNGVDPDHFARNLPSSAQPLAQAA